MFCVDFQLTLCCIENYRAHILLVIGEMALAACLSLRTGWEKAKKKPNPNHQMKQPTPQNLHSNYFRKKTPNIQPQELCINNVRKFQQVTWSALANLENI